MWKAGGCLQRVGVSQDGTNMGRGIDENWYVCISPEGGFVNESARYDANDQNLVRPYPPLKYYSNKVPILAQIKCQSAWHQGFSISDKIPTQERSKKAFRIGSRLKQACPDMTCDEMGQIRFEADI